MDRTNGTIRGLGFSHVAVAASDFDRSLAFYLALGLAVRAQWGEGDGRMALLDIGGGGRLELMAAPRRDGAPAAAGPIAHLAFSAQDVDAAYRAALEAGAAGDRPPFDMPLNSRPLRMALRVAFVRGPDGEEIEFCKQIIRAL